ncbi:MAG: AAA family ATPase [Acidimicrobiia bacterium]|nr:AAA family ATPase [Acidimicrobiia bacterium]
MNLSLKALRDHNVFRSTLQHHDLGALHVSFDSLVGNSSTEGRLWDAVHRSEPCAVIGTSGSGKSSVISHVLGPLVPDIAPLRVMVAHALQPDEYTLPHLADQLLHTLRDEAERTLSSDVDAALGKHTQTTTTRRTGAVGGGMRWLGIKLAKDIERQTTIERNSSLHDKTDALRNVLLSIASEDLLPVLIFDDTDRWLIGDTEAATVQWFFDKSLRWLLESCFSVEPPMSLVVAVHPHYFDNVAQAELLAYLDTPITIPRLPGPPAIRRILQYRIEQYTGYHHPDLTDIMTTDGLDAIYALYDAERNLRRTIQVCHIAVVEALDAGVSRLTAQHIQAANNAG